MKNCYQNNSSSADAGRKTDSIIAAGRPGQVKKLLSLYFRTRWSRKKFCYQFQPLQIDPDTIFDSFFSLPLNPWEQIRAVKNEKELS